MLNMLTLVRSTIQSPRKKCRREIQEMTGDPAIRSTPALKKGRQ
jgi:hypothetical protein